MRFCQPHWQRLKAAIEEKGMMHLAHGSGQKLAASIERQLTGTDSAADFDPLANATWAVYSQFLKNVGLAGMDGDVCPLCDVDEKGPSTSQNWIDGSTDDQLATARHLGLMPPPN